MFIDQKPVHGTGLIWNHIPNGAEDETGDRPLAERARWLKHADFFVGLSSGLSWLAWAAGTPVVMISGFTHPLNEFATPYRIVNYHTITPATAAGTIQTIASITRTSCGVRATRTRRASSSARG